MSRILIADDLCRGCGLCVAFCPRHTLRLAARFNKDGLPPVEYVDPDLCVGCGTCALMCPHVAIVLVERTAKAKEGTAR